MKIAFVSDTVYPWEKGGAQKRVWEMASRLADQHDVHLYGMHYWEGPTIIERDGVTLHGVSDPKSMYVNGRRSIIQALVFALLVTVPLLRENFDVVECNKSSYFHIFSGKLHSLLRGSVLVSVHPEVWDEYWYMYLGWKGFAGRMVERLAVRCPDRLISVTQGNVERLASMGVPRWKIRPGLVGGVDFDAIRDIPPADEQVDLIFVGRLVESKGVESLVRAVAQANDDANVTASIIGDGPQREYLESLSKELGVSEEITFHGVVEEDEAMLGRLKSAKAFIYPAVPEGGWSISVLEANACGLPTISVKTGYPPIGDNEVVRHGETGILVDEGSPHALTEAIFKVLSDDEYRKAMSENAISFARDHDWDLVAEELERFYREIVNEQTKD